jgi:hypothetical protein
VREAGRERERERQRERERERERERIRRQGIVGHQGQQENLRNKREPLTGL